MTRARLRPRQPIAQENDTYLIPLTQNKYAIVDAIDLWKVQHCRWHIHKNHECSYAATNTKRANRSHTTLFMHRAILNVPPSLEVDHINGDGLDNRRQNIRLCTHSQNLQNQRSRFGSSRSKGVSWHKINQRWRAVIHPNGRSVHLGMFDNELDAARAYDTAAKEYFGEFARLNFPVILQPLEAAMR